MGVIELGVADMIMVFITLAICVAILTIKMFNNETRLNRLEESCDVLENVAEGLSGRCDTHKKSIEYLSKSVRELNGVVEAAVKVKEETSDNKPDTKALIGGWTTEEGQTRIDASHISAGMIDGQSLMNCELPNLSESAREKIFELLGVKVPEKEKPADATHVGIGVGDGQTLAIPVRDTGRVLMYHGKTVANHWHGRLWTNSEGHIYELPEGCFILGDTPYEMDQ